MNTNNLEDFIGFMLANDMIDDNFGLKENNNNYNDNEDNSNNIDNYKVKDYKIKERRKK